MSFSFKMRQLRLRHVRWELVPKWQVGFQPRFPTQTPAFWPRSVLFQSLRLFFFNVTMHQIILISWPAYYLPLPCSKIAYTCTHTHVKLNEICLLVLFNFNTSLYSCLFKQWSCLCILNLKIRMHSSTKEFHFSSSFVNAFIWRDSSREESLKLRLFQKI